MILEGYPPTHSYEENGDTYRNERVSYVFNDFFCVGNPSKVRWVTFDYEITYVRENWDCFKGNCQGLNS